MNFEKLENNIVDMIKEEQIKLGYRSEKVRLYYPLLSLNRLLGENYSIKQMRECLKAFCEKCREKYGEIEISNQKEQFCFLIPPKGSDYIYQNTGKNEFLVEFINTIRNHNCTIEELLNVFHNHSHHVHIEKVNHGEFDYLIYFEDGIPDDFLYCLTVEKFHIIYHRFTKEDYKDFQF